MPKGLLGKVQNIDGDGNAHISFEGIEAAQGLLKDNLGNLSVLSQADVLQERAKREEVVALLAAPTQAAGALGVADDEGNMVLLHACLHGVCTVAEQLLDAGTKPGLVNKDNKTALLLACAHGHEKAAALLVDPTKAADALDAVGDDGFSALMWAEERGLRQRSAPMVYLRVRCMSTSNENARR